MGINEPTIDNGVEVVINTPTNLNNFGANVLQICTPELYSGDLAEYYNQIFPLEISGNFKIVTETEVKVALNCVKQLHETMAADFNELLNLARSEMRASEVWLKIRAEKRIFTRLKQSLEAIEPFRANSSKLNLMLHVFCGTCSTLPSMRIQ